MNKKAKQAGSLLLAAAVTATVATGCSSPKANSNGDGGSTGETPYWEMLDNVSDTSELPDWKGEKLEINFWDCSSSGGLDIPKIAENDVVWNEIERVTGVRINTDKSYDNGGSSIDAKLPMVLNSGDLPTIIAGYPQNTYWQDLYNNGYLADLTEYYDNGDLSHVEYWFPRDKCEKTIYADASNKDGDIFLIPYGEGYSRPYYQTILEASGIDTVKEYDPEYFNMYGQIPKNATGRTTSLAIWVREDILQKLYPDSLTAQEIKDLYMENGTFTEEQVFDVKMDSAEDFFELLRAVKKEIASGEYLGADGKPVEVTYGPHTENDNWYWMNFLSSLVNGTTCDYFANVDLTADEDSMIKAFYQDDYWYNWMKELNSLVREDVISQNSLMENNAQFLEKRDNAHYAVVYCYPMDSSEIPYRPIWVDAPVNEKVGNLVAVDYNTFMGIMKDSLKSKEQLDQLVHFIDYLNSPVGLNCQYWGPKSANLFTEDENGKRTYTDKELEKCQIYGTETKNKYGLISPFQRVGSDYNFTFFQGGGAPMLAPDYLAKSDLGRVEGDAFNYFNPGVLDGKSFTDNTTAYITNDVAIYVLGQEIDGLKSFWSARNGFENAIKKAVAAGSDEGFERLWQETVSFAKDNGLTEEAIQEYTKLWVDSNREDLQKAGLLK